MIKKLAATTAVNDADIEKAFSDQASGFVENKLGPLMKAPHNIGFEVVRKSEDNTRIIGIFAFKVEDSLLFAPVFFLNGDIKGPLLYRCDTKTFVPANKDWATYLIGSIQDSEGKGNNTALRGNYPPYVMMDKMTFTPTREKRASSKADPLNCGDPIPFTIELNPANKKEVVVNVDSIYSPTTGNVWDGTMLKVALYDDGTVHCKCDGDEFLLRKDDGTQFEKSSTGDRSTISTPEGNVLMLGSIAHNRIHTGLFKKSAADAYNWDPDFILPFVNMVEEHPLQSLIKESKNKEEIINKVLDAADSSPKFTENLMECYESLESLVPDSFGSVEKKSSAGELKIVYTANSVPSNQESLTRFFKDEYYLKDTRDKSKLTEAYTCDPVRLESVNYPGLYDVLKADSEYEDNVLILPDKRSCPCSCTNEVPFYNDTVLIKGNKICSAEHEHIYGIRKDCVDAYPLYTDTVKEGKTYVIVDNNSFNGFIKVLTTKKSDDVTYITKYRRGNMFYSEEDGGNKKIKAHMNPLSESTIVINRKSSISNDNLFGSGVKFVEISPYKEGDDVVYFEYLGGFDKNLSIDNIIWTEFSEPKVTVSIDASFNKESRYRIESLGEKSPALTKLNMLVKLARDLKIHADDAYNIIDKASENGSYSFMLNGVEKKAFKLRIAEHPRFDNEFDSEFGIPVEPNYEYKLDTQAEQISPEPSHIGDSYDPSTLSGLSNATVVTSDPASLRELANTYKLPHVFEHGVVGTLADTFDSIAMLDKYIGKIEDAVDALYRILFLFYWKPGDFEKLYGTDDMTNFEAETRADAEALGALLLRLLKKTENYRKGNMPTSGEEQSIK